MRLVYRPNHPLASENGMVPADLAQPRSTDPHFYVISDEMEPTRHMATGEMMTSKAKFRQRTKAAGCVEVGSETATLLKPRKQILLDRAKRREDIRRALYEVRNGRR